MGTKAITAFTIADSKYFIGLIAMLASLRRQGHDFPVVVLDLGLTSPQREVLERDFGVGLVEQSEIVGLHPYLLGSFPHLLEPEGIFVYLDADVIVTRPLDDLIAAAADGMLCVFADEIVAGRWFEEWESGLSLRGPLRDGPYVNLGCLVYSTEQFPDLLRRWWECTGELPDTLTFPMDWSEPFAFGDQDVLNALLMSEVAADRQWVLPPETQPMRPEQLARTKLVNAQTLACTYQGRSTALLHPVSKPKPWQPQDRQALYGSGYEQCLRELVACSAGSIRASGTPLPTWLQPGWRGTLWWRRAVWRTAVRRRLRRIRQAARVQRR